MDWLYKWFEFWPIPSLFTLAPNDNVPTGYVYYRASTSLLIISVYCVVTCMGPLFMTSIIINLINDTLRVFLMQYKDGVGSLYHVVFMVCWSNDLFECWLPISEIFQAQQVFDRLHGNYSDWSCVLILRSFVVFISLLQHYYLWTPSRCFTGLLALQLYQCWSAALSCTSL